MTLWQHICPQFSFFLRKLFCYSQGVKAGQRKESWTEDHMLEVTITVFLFIPGNQPDPGSFYPACDLLWPIMESLRSVEPVLWGSCWARDHTATMLVPHYLFPGHVQERDRREVNPDFIQSQYQTRDNKNIALGDVLNSNLMPFTNV